MKEIKLIAKGTLLSAWLYDCDVMSRPSFNIIFSLARIMTSPVSEGLERKPTSGATANLQPPSFVGEPQQCVTAQEGTDIILTVELTPSGGAPTAISW